MEHHVRAVHEKLRPFACDRCPRKFSARGALKKHISEVHDQIKPFKCHVCDYKTARRNEFITHMSKRHGIEKEKMDEF